MELLSGVAQSQRLRNSVFVGTDESVLVHLFLSAARAKRETYKLNNRCSTLLPTLHTKSLHFYCMSPLLYI